MTAVCYLCGLQIEGKRSRDHVPPQQLWSPEVRRAFNLAHRFVVLDAHLDGPAADMKFALQRSASDVSSGCGTRLGADAA
jgi:hypothetical protein